MSITRDEKEAIIKKFQLKENDTGSSAVQIALNTERIAQISEHTKIHKKDHATKRSLIKCVNSRRKHLNYLKKNKNELYKEIIKELGLRK